MDGELICSDCGENDFGEFDEDTQTSMCMSCGNEQGPRKHSIYTHFAIARVDKLNPVKNNTKLKHVTLNVGKDKTVGVVTNAKYIAEGETVVVALVGAVVPAGSNVDENANAITITKTTVGGMASHGMLCDAPALAWKGPKDKLVKLEGEGHVLGSKPSAVLP